MSLLRQELKKRNTVLSLETEQIVARATPQLWHTYATFPSGTKHTPEHTQMVERLAGWLLPDELIGTLTDDELAILIQACHFHDLGMSGTEVDNLTADSRDQVRREHAVSVGDRIQTHWQAFGFPNETVAEILALVCKGHRPRRENSVATWDNLPKSRVLGPQRSVRVRLVSAIVYAADELHIGEDRAPKREEEFQGIITIEARKHWRRHQAVQGPVIEDGQLVFEGSVNCPAFEKDLRVALAKAFRSVWEMNQEFSRYDIKASGTPVRFTWNRKKAWSLSIGRLCSDLRPRSREEIVESVLVGYEEAMVDSDSIHEYCDEQPPDEEKKREISEGVADFVTRNYLVAAANGLYALCTEERAVNAIFDLAKQADNSETILVDQAATKYEHAILKSALGTSHVRSRVIPSLRSTFNVTSLTPISTPFNLILESSPTATRILQLLAPPPSVLVQSDLLQFACLAGTCADLLNDPEAILNTE